MRAYEMALIGCGLALVGVGVSNAGTYPSGGASAPAIRSATTCNVDGGQCMSTPLGISGTPTGTIGSTNVAAGKTVTVSSDLTGWPASWATDSSILTGIHTRADMVGEYLIVDLGSDKLITRVQLVRYGDPGDAITRPSNFKIQSCADSLCASSTDLVSATGTSTVTTTHDFTATTTRYLRLITTTQQYVEIAEFRAYELESVPVPVLSVQGGAFRVDTDGVVSSVGGAVEFGSRIHGPAVDGYAETSTTGWLTSFGDSITLGTNTTDPATYNYSYLMNAALGWTSATYKAHAGDRSYTQTPLIYAEKIPFKGNKVNTVMLGANDQMVNSSGNSTLRDYYTKIMGCHLAFLAIPDRFKTFFFTGAVTYSGSWTNSNNGYNIGKYSSGAGATATIAFNGTGFIVCGIRLISQAGSFDVAVDGVSQATIPIDLSPAMEGSNFIPWMTVVTGLEDGAHSVVFTSSSDATYGYLDWFAPMTSEWDGTMTQPVLVGNIIGQAAGYPGGGSAGNVAAYNANLLALVNQLRGYGLNVTYVDTYSALDYATDMSGDGVHPNDAGQVKLKTAFLTAQSAAVTHTKTASFRDGHIWMEPVMRTPLTCDRAALGKTYLRYYSGSGTSLCVCGLNSAGNATWFVAGQTDSLAASTACGVAW